MEGTARFGSWVGEYGDVDDDLDLPGGPPPKLFGRKKKAAFSDPHISETRLHDVVGRANVWEKYKDKTGAAYFHNPSTGETQWVRPEGCPSEATMSVDDTDEDDGNLFITECTDTDSEDPPMPFTGFIAQEKQQQQHCSPTNLADILDDDTSGKWRRYYDDTQTPYYSNELLDITQWDRPTDYNTADDSATTDSVADCGQIQDLNEELFGVLGDGDSPVSLGGPGGMEDLLGSAEPTLLGGAPTGADVLDCSLGGPGNKVTTKRKRYPKGGGGGGGGGSGKGEELSADVIALLQGAPEEKVGGGVLGSPGKNRRSAESSRGRRRLDRAKGKDVAEVSPVSMPEEEKVKPAVEVPVVPAEKVPRRLPDLAEPRRRVPVVARKAQPKVEQQPQQIQQPQSKSPRIESPQQSPEPTPNPVSKAKANRPRVVSFSKPDATTVAACEPVTVPVPPVAAAPMMVQPLQRSPPLVALPSIELGEHWTKGWKAGANKPQSLSMTIDTLPGAEENTWGTPGYDTYCLDGSYKTYRDRRQGMVKNAPEKTPQKAATPTVTPAEKERQVLQDLRVQHQIPMKAVFKKLGGTLGKEWAKKWVSLSETQLSFAEDETGSANRKIVSLNAVTRIIGVAESEQKHSRQHVFELEVKDQKPKSFQANSAREANVWVSAITDLVAFNRTRVTRDLFSTSTVGDVWADMQGEFMYKPKSDLVQGQSLSRELSKFFGGNKWPARWVWTEDKSLLYTRVKGGVPEKTLPFSSFQLCAKVEPSEMREMQAPGHLLNTAFEVLTEDRRLFFACETRASRDKWVAYIEDALYSTSDTVAVSKASPLMEKKKKWMDPTWTTAEWGTWESDAVALWQEEEVDVYFDVDMIDEALIREGETGEEWPDKYSVKHTKHAWSHEDENRLQMTISKNQFGKWENGFSVDTRTLRVASSGTVDGVPIDAARVLSVNGNLVFSATDLKHYLALPGKGSSAVLEVLPQVFTGAEYYSVGEDDTVLCKAGIDMVLHPPLEAKVRAPFPMPACLDFTPGEMRVHKKNSREASKKERRDLHQALQISRKQQAEESEVELHKRTQAGISYAGHAAARTLADAVREVKEKADTKYTQSLVKRADNRFRDNFPELSSESVICNYKCLLRFVDPRHHEAVDMDAHVIVTNKHICYYSGGRALCTFRGWIPLQHVASVQNARLCIDGSTYAESYKTVDWLEEDDVGSGDALQVFTTYNRCYTFIKVRAISLEKAKAVENAMPNDELLRYLDNAWREAQTEVPLPDYDYRE